RDARRAVRVVLDVAHRRRRPVLVPLEVDDAVLLLVTAAEAAHRDVAVVVAAAGLLEWLRERLLGCRPGDLREVGDRPEARARRHRLELTNGHLGQPSKIPIESPSRRVTIAFFQCGRRPVVVPTRRAFPRTFIVHTPVTFTPNRRSIACLISCLFASGATSK